MNDLISRQLVMKTLCERRCGDKPKGCPSGFCTESLAVDCIPSEKPAQQWIPCSERLPKPEENPVLVSGFEGVSLGWCFYPDEWVTATGILFIGVDAWMPLPDPYKAERSEE